MIRVMVAGLPGKMATLIGRAVGDAPDMELMLMGLSEVDDEIRLSLKWTPTKLVPLLEHERWIERWKPDIIVDFTAPTAVNRNAELYCKCGAHFVMGTTGGDRDLLVKTVQQSRISAVIAPNMAKQIVVFQAMMEYAAKKFPNSFEGYRLVIRESHQQGKKDTSGTAKAMVQYFNDLGIPFTKEQIIMERDPLAQEVVWGVPKKYLGGHAYHEYTLLSEDGTVLFQFRHNVNGRTIYVPLVLDSIRFLYHVTQDNRVKGKVFSAIDVIKEWRG